MLFLLLIIMIGLLCYTSRFPGRSMLIGIGYFILGFLYPVFGMEVFYLLETMYPKSFDFLGNSSFVIYVLIPIILIIFLWNRKRIVSVGLIFSLICFVPLILMHTLASIEDSKLVGAEQTILMLEEYKKQNAVYPEDINVVGLKIDEYLISYHSNKESFCLCFDRFVGDHSITPNFFGFYPDGVCYDSSKNKWGSFYPREKTQCLKYF